MDALWSHFELWRVYSLKGCFSYPYSNRQLFERHIAPVTADAFPSINLAIC